MIGRWALLLCIPVLASCTGVPFRQTARVPLEPSDPRTVVERFAEKTPASFQLLNSVVFEYNWRTFPAIGYVDVDTNNRRFKMACLNPLGVKLFELSGDENGTTTDYVIAPLAKFGDIGTAVANDIRKIYFDLLPGPDARVWKGSSSIRFRQALGSGTVEYVFAGPEGDLVEKNYYGDNGIAWRVSYYEYVDRDGKRFPRGIVLLNYRYHYRLTVRQKEFLG